jgi:nucleotide-binding universal stress UspA family protein
MIRRHRRINSAAPVAPLPAHTVRLLRGEEELQAAVERAKAFERRGSDEYQRRVGTYDRLLSYAHEHAASVTALKSINAPGEGRKSSSGTDGDNVHGSFSAAKAEILMSGRASPGCSPS